MYCINCGTKVRNDQTLCAKCLALVTKKTPSQLRVSSTVNPNAATKTKSLPGAAVVDLAGLIRLRSRRRLSVGYLCLVLGFCLWAANPQYLRYFLGTFRYGWGFPFHSSEFKVFIFGAVLQLLGLCVVVRRLINIKDKKHAAYKIAAELKYGSIQALSQTFAKAQQAGSLPIGRYQLNPYFLFKIGFFFFKIYPVSQLSWAYKKVIKRSFHFIPLGKDYSLVMHFGRFGKVEIKDTELTVNQRLGQLVRLCPQAVFGTNRVLGTALLSKSKK